MRTPEEVAREVFSEPSKAPRTVEQLSALLSAWRGECVKDLMKLYNDEVVKRMDAEAERDRLREQLAAAIVINGEIPELRAENEEHSLLAEDQEDAYQILLAENALLREALEKLSDMKGTWVWVNKIARDALLRAKGGAS